MARKQSLKRRWMWRIGGILLAGMVVAISISAAMHLLGMYLAGKSWTERSATHTAPLLWREQTESSHREAELLLGSEEVRRALARGEASGVRSAMAGLRDERGYFWSWHPVNGVSTASDPAIAVAAAAFLARASPGGWFSCGTDACLGTVVQGESGHLVVGRRLSDEALDDIATLTLQEVLLWSPEAPLRSTARNASGGHAPIRFSEPLLRDLRDSAHASKFGEYDLELTDYGGYRYAASYSGRSTAGSGRIPHYVHLASIGPDVPHRILFAVPSAVLLVGAHWAIVVLMTVCGALLLPALLWMLSRMLERILRPVEQLSAASAEIARGRLDIAVEVAAEAELGEFVRDFNAMTRGLRETQAALVESERAAALAPLKKEMEIASRIQSSILPVSTALASYEISARMKPAATMGGDYYDVRPTPDGGCWVGIGDVAGHGVTSGLVMLMVQSAIASVVEHAPGARPDEVLNAVNRLVHDNVRNRLGSDEHVTLSLLRLHPDGRIAFAGAHEDIVVIRSSGEVQRLETTGTWLGAIPDITPFISVQQTRVQQGDLILLHTDGVTEAANPQRERLGLERVIERVAAKREQTVEQLRDEVFGAVDLWSATRDDDATVMVLRYLGAPAVSVAEAA